MPGLSCGAGRRHSQACASFRTLTNQTTHFSFHPKARSKLVSSSFRRRKEGKGLHLGSTQQTQAEFGEKPAGAGQTCQATPQVYHFLEPSGGSLSLAHDTRQSQLPGPAPEARTLLCCGLLRIPWPWLLPPGFAPLSC